jgi:hypothetical protein
VALRDRVQDMQQDDRIQPAAHAHCDASAEQPQPVQDAGDVELEIARGLQRSATSLKRP